MRISIFQKIALGTFLIVLFSVTMIGMMISFLQETTLRADANSDLVFAATQSVNRIDHFFFDRQSDLEFLLSEESTHFLLGGNDMSDKLEYLRGMERAKKLYASISIYDSKGNRIGDTRGVDIGKNEIDKPHVKEALLGNNYSDPRPVFSSSLGIPVIHFSGPLKNDQGDVLGMISIRLPISKLHNIIKESRLIYPNLEVETDLVDKDGLILFSTHQPDAVLTKRVSGLKIYRDIQELGLSQHVFEDADSGLLYVAARQKGYLNYEGNDWVLIFTMNQADIFASLRQLQSRLILFSFILLAIGLVIALYFSRLISRPIHQLNKVVTAVSKGDLSVRSGVRTGDEIGHLAKEFDSMVGEVASVRSGLEEVVSARTHDLELEKDKLQTFLDSMGDGAFVVDDKGVITFFNPMAEELSGYDSKEALGRHYGDILKFVKESDGSVNRKFVDSALRRGQKTRMANHTVLVRKDGTQLPVADSAAPLKDNNTGTIIGCIVIFRDETRARKVEKAKSEFISVASHQLRTPLSAIRWYLEILMGDDIGEMKAEQKDYLKDAYVSTKRMADLVSGLLNTSRIEAGRVAVVPESIDVVSLAEQTLKELEPQIKKRKHKITFRYSKGLPAVPTDGKLLREVLVNVLVNAIKYTPDGGEISLDIKEKNGKLSFSVKDNGYGIPADQQKEVFSKFFRGDNIIKHDTDGTGLGLYVVKEVAELLGGYVEFESTEGKGTVFNFVLPLKGSKKREGEKSLA